MINFIIRTIVLRVVTDICLEYMISACWRTMSNPQSKEDKEGKAALLMPVRLGSWTKRTIMQEGFSELEWEITKGVLDDPTGELAN
jgi:hypothetical protein